MLSWLNNIYDISMYNISVIMQKSGIEPFESENDNKFTENDKLISPAKFMVGRA